MFKIGLDFSIVDHCIDFPDVSSTKMGGNGVLPVRWVCIITCAAQLLDYL